MNRITGYGYGAAQQLLGGVVLALLTWVCFQLQISLATTSFVYLIAIVLLSLLGSFISSAVLSIIAVACLAYFFAPPIFDFRIADPLEVVLVAAFLLTSLIVTGLVGRARKQAEAAVRAAARAEQAERERGLAIDAIPALVWSTLPDGSLDFINQRWEEIGLSLDDLRGSNWTAVIHPDDRPGVVDRWDTAVETGTPYENMERVRRVDGEYRWFLSRARPLRDKLGKIVRWYGIDTDIEDRKRAEEALHKVRAELAHASRVTTLGELTASIAHEVNQPLAAIVANAEACLRWLDRGTPNLDEARRNLGSIIKDGNRAGEVTRRVRALVSKADAQKAPLDINDVVNEVVALVRGEAFGHRVSLRLELAPVSSVVFADRVQLQQVIINLAINGMEAMQPVTDRPRELVIRSHQDEARQVVVTVTDCGGGISEATADRLFDAFFTTKTSGMGMGLSICRSIIEAHGGRVWAAPSPPRGAAFHFTLPLHHEDAS